MTNEARIAKDLLRLAKMIAAVDEKKNDQEEKEKQQITEIVKALKDQKMEIYAFITKNKMQKLGKVFGSNVQSMTVLEFFSKFVKTTEPKDKKNA